MALDASRPTTTPVGVTPPAEPLGFWASYQTARRNVLELIPRVAYHEPVLTGGARPGWIMVQDPDAIERVMKTAVDDYPKSSVLKRLMRPRQGSNMIIAEGEAWRKQRKAMAPVFAHRALDASVPAMTDAAEATCARLGDGGQIDMFPQMVQATCDVIADVTLSGRDAIDRDVITDSINRFIATVGRISILDLMNAPRWIPRPSEILDRSRSEMDRRADEVIAARRARGPSDPPDLLDLLVASAGDDPDSDTLIEARNNLTGFLFAGHETTALSLTWALYLLGLDQSVQDKARAIAQDTLGDRAAASADIPHLGYHGQIIEESLRLYPPAGLLSRTATKPDTLAGKPVKPGMTVMLPIYAIHRHTELWDDPNGFNPDRFAPEAVAKRHKFAFLPFGAGPRICIGYAFAMWEAQVILATLLARYRFSLPQGFEPDPRMWFTLRPHTGMPLIVERL
ncbi:MAG: cytochrome P450 [Pseudomonadota bacterium]